MTAPSLVPSASPVSLDPLPAGTAPDPYPFYPALVGERPFAWNAALGLWVAASAEAVAAVLADPAVRVRPTRI